MPQTSKSTSYEDWHKLVVIWTEITRDRKTGRLAIVVPLEGEDVLLELAISAISNKIGVYNIADQLNKLCTKDELTEKHNVLEVFDLY